MKATSKRDHKNPRVPTVNIKLAAIESAITMNEGGASKRKFDEKEQGGQPSNGVLSNTAGKFTMAGNAKGRFVEKSQVNQPSKAIKTHLIQLNLEAGLKLSD